jgi:hypothetical protein
MTAEGQNGRERGRLKNDKGKHAPKIKPMGKLGTRRRSTQKEAVKQFRRKQRPTAAEHMVNVMAADSPMLDTRSGWNAVCQYAAQIIKDETSPSVIVAAAFVAVYSLPDTELLPLFGKRDLSDD